MSEWLAIVVIVVVALFAGGAARFYERRERSATLLPPSIFEPFTSIQMTPDQKVDRIELLLRDAPAQRQQNEALGEKLDERLGSLKVPAVRAKVA